MSPEDVNKLRMLVRRQIILRHKAANGDYGEDHEHKSIHNLIHETDMVSLEIKSLLTPRFVLDLLDAYEAHHA